MDVILDSNTYLADIRMESIRFKNLFDYLRRVRSSLVLPRVIREETIAKYIHDLTNQIKRTQRAVDDLNKMFDPADKIRISPPDPKYLVRDLRKKFRVPAKGLGLKYLPDASQIDASDVFLRGVNRRRPADENGEELRDVILWLIALHYAESTGKEVGLITGDKGFWQESEPHKHIQEDIEQRKVKVKLYKTIDDFIRDRAPAPAEIDEKTTLKFFNVRTLSTAILIEALKVVTKARRLDSFSVQHSQAQEISFQQATLYDIDADTKLAEIIYTVEATFDFVFNKYNPPWLGGFGTGSAQRFAERWATPTTLDPNGILSSIGTPFYTSGDAGGAGMTLGSPLEPAEEQRKYKFVGKASVSVRLENKKSSLVELDGVQLLSFEQIRSDPDPVIDIKSTKA